jgi:hypothetical protein
MAASALAVVAACTPTVDVVVADVEERPALTTPGVAGRDGGLSIALGGRSTWVFGDSFLTVPDVDGLQLHSTSFFSTADLDAADGVGPVDEPVDEVGAPLPFLPATPEEQAFTLAHLGDDCAATDGFPCGARFATWAGASVVVDDTAIVFYELLRPDVNGFNGLGSSVATWRAVDLAAVRPVGLLFADDEPRFATAAIVDDEGLVVVLGCTSAFLTAECRLARVAPADVTDRAAWRFWDGGAWVADVDRAVVVVNAAPIATLSRNAHLGRYLLVYSGVVSSEVRARSAERLEGPWSDEVVLFTADHGDDQPVYDAYWHPEYDEGGQTILVSHTRNLPEVFHSETALTVVTLR